MTKIEWTHYTAPDGRIVKGFTWNPAKGCSRAGYHPVNGGPKLAHPGCKHCYAEGVCRRNLQGEVESGVAAWDGTIETFPERMLWPFTRYRQRRDGLPMIGFTHSLSDPGHPSYPVEFWKAVQGAMLLSPWIIWKDLTKRPDRMRELLERFTPSDCVAAWRAMLTDGQAWMCLSPAAASLWNSRSAHAWSDFPHIHRYVSVSDQDTTALIPELLRMPCAVRGVSLEPMTGPVDLSPWLAQLDHVILGGESGSRARPFDLAWAEAVLDQCGEAGVPAYVKQLGSKPVCDRTEQWARKDGMIRFAEIRDGRIWPDFGSKGQNFDDWPTYLQVRQHVGLPKGCR